MESKDTYIHSPPLVAEHAILGASIQIAVENHGFQSDESGHLYLLHLFRVMNKFTDPIDKAIAVLHDVLEDTMLPAYELRETLIARACLTHLNKSHVERLANFIVETVIILTHKPDVSYDNYILNISKLSPTAVRIKLADLEDNHSMYRNPGTPALTTEKQMNRLKRYRRAHNTLLGYPNADQIPR